MTEEKPPDLPEHLLFPRLTIVHRSDGAVLTYQEWPCICGDEDHGD